MTKHYLPTMIVFLTLSGLFPSTSWGVSFISVEGDVVKECDRLGVCRLVRPADTEGQNGSEQGDSPSEAILLGLVMVKFEAGSFTMGSHEGDEGRVEVTLNRPFEIGKHEVTQRQWFAVMDTNPSYFSKKEYCRDDYIYGTDKHQGGERGDVSAASGGEGLLGRHTVVFPNAQQKGGE